MGLLLLRLGAGGMPLPCGQYVGGDLRLQAAHVGTSSLAEVVSDTVGLRPNDATPAHSPNAPRTLTTNTPCNAYVCDGK